MDPQDFPITRSIIGRLDGWFGALVSPLLPLVAVPLPALGGGYWAFKEQTPQVVMACKAVRMISGLRAALHLADMGFVAETGSLLRMVSDFADEILSLADGIRRGALTADQTRFVEQFFVPLITDPDELDANRQGRFVTRGEISKGSHRIGSQSDEDTARLRRVSNVLKLGYDKYVHGGYLTAVELFNPYTGAFMLNGHEATERRRPYKVALAGKLHESLTALAFMADSFDMDHLAFEIGIAARELLSSGETGVRTIDDEA